MNYAAQAFNIVQNFFLAPTEEDLDALPAQRVKFHSPFDVQREWLNVDPAYTAGQLTHVVQLVDEGDGFILSDDFAARLEEAMDEVGSTSFYVGGAEKGVGVRVIPDVVMDMPERTDIAPLRTRDEVMDWTTKPSARQLPIRSVGESEVYYPVDRETFKVTASVRGNALAGTEETHVVVLDHQGDLAEPNDYYRSLLDNDSLRAAIGAVPQEEQEKPMEVKDGLAGGPESLVTLAQVWQRDCLARGTPVRTGHLRLKELLIEAIEKEDNRALQALQTAGFEWGYDKSKELASLSFTGGTLVVQRGVTEEAEAEAKSDVVLIDELGGGDLYRWGATIGGVRYSLVSFDQFAVNEVKYELTVDNVRGYLVLDAGRYGQETFYHENALFPGYRRELKSFYLARDVLDRFHKHGGMFVDDLPE